MKNEKELLLKKSSYDFDDLLLLVKILRGKDGCPWDMEQTHKSIRNDLIEETYEVIEAIDTDDPELLREELGDVLFQVVFHAQIELDNNSFGMDEIIDEVCKKMIYRHPHVFGDVSVENTAQVLKNWEALKSDEKQRNTLTDKLRSIPPQLPALMRATKVGKKASFFDFPDADSVLKKLYEEADELSLAIEKNDTENIDEEIGDLLLSITSLCRKLGVDPEKSLNKSTDKFINRFELVEKEVVSQGKDVKSMSLVELDKIWDEIKYKNV